MRETLAVLLMAIGLFFSLVTGIGMLRFSDLFYKLHLGSKCLTAGAVSVLAGAALLYMPWSVAGKLFLLVFFLTLSNPIASHALGRSAYRRGHRPKSMVRDDYQDRRHG
jgi:multicomponent Na+:H+ antiporter subunit G